MKYINKNSLSLYGILCLSIPASLILYLLYPNNYTLALFAYLSLIASFGMLLIVILFLKHK